MPPSRLAILALVLATSAALQAQGPQGTGGTSRLDRRALLIGVSSYARTSGGAGDEWWDLSSTADVVAISDALHGKFGFTDAGITTLTTRVETRRQAILAAFEKLIRDTQKGDVVFIHYSGHGSPVLDLDGDEIDGLDEAIVPSDYVSRHDGSRNITDDTIGALLMRLRARQPASVTLTFDSCYSGTQTRGGRMVVRGGDYLDDRPAARGGDDTDLTGMSDRQAFARGYVVISAARPDQIAIETDDGYGGQMGLLSYALVRHLRAAGPTTTYRDLFDHVLDTVTRRNPAQVPQLEGDLDEILMSGMAAPPQPYVDTRVEDGRLMLDAGALHGITEGSRFALYPAGTRTFDGSGMLAHADASVVRATDTVLVLTDPVVLDRLRASRAVEVAHKHSDTTARLHLADLDGVSAFDPVRRELQRFADDRGLVRLTSRGDWDLKVCRNPCREAREPRAAASGGFATLIRQDGSIVDPLPDGPSLPDTLTRLLERESRRRLVAALDHRDPRIAVDVRLVPVAVTRNASGEVVAAKPRAGSSRTAGGQLTMKIGDYFMIEARNGGPMDAYVTILDLSPDGSISPLWPHPRLGSRVQDNKLRGVPAGAQPAWVLIPLPYVFQVGPPAGLEIVKAIATDTPADFSLLLTPEATRTRGASPTEQSPIGQLLAAAAGQASAAALRAAPPDPTVWSIGSFTFAIADAASGR
jgi:hypothetical protein